MTPAGGGDRAAVKRLAADIQDATGDSVTLAYVDQGYTGETATDAAAAAGVTLHVAKFPEAKRGFVLLPRRWVGNDPLPGRRAAEDRSRIGDYALDKHGQLLRIRDLVAEATVISRRNGDMRVWIGVYAARDSNRMMLDIVNG